MRVKTFEVEVGMFCFAIQMPGISGFAISKKRYVTRNGAFRSGQRWVEKYLKGDLQ